MSQTRRRRQARRRYTRGRALLCLGAVRMVRAWNDGFSATECTAAVMALCDGITLVRRGRRP